METKDPKQRCHISNIFRYYYTKVRKKFWYALKALVKYYILFYIVVYINFSIYIPKFQVLS